MRRLLAWLAGGVAGATALRVLRARLRKPAPPPTPERDPRAEELRRKIAQAREAAADEEEFEAAGMGPETILEEKPAPAPGTPGEDVEEARRRVHEEARAAAEEMRRSAGPDAG